MPHGGCGSANVLEIKSRPTWKCRERKRQFSIKAGTIFEASPLSLSKWLPAVWLVTNTKNGTSSCELARALGVTQKTGWFMFHRIRLAMGTSEYAKKLSGYIETDETYVGGKACLKRTLGGTYISVRPFHFDAYLTEQTFRFNNRDMVGSDGGRFVKVLKGVDGRRLTYARLITANPMRQAKLAIDVMTPNVQDVWRRWHSPLSDDHNVIYI